MPLSRRKEVAEILRRHEVLLFEDDAYGKLEPNAVPLASLVPERTYFAASLSKCTAPGLRVSLLLTPDQASAEVLASALRASVQCPRFLWSRWSLAGFRMAAPMRLLALFSMKHPRDRSWLRTCSCSMRIHDIRTATTSGSLCPAIGARGVRVARSKARVGYRDRRIIQRRGKPAQCDQGFAWRREQPRRIVPSAGDPRGCIEIIGGQSTRGLAWRSCNIDGV
jgi:hypothetical protein